MDLEHLKTFWPVYASVVVLFVWNSILTFLRRDDVRKRAALDAELQRHKLEFGEAKRTLESLVRQSEEARTLALKMDGKLDTLIDRG